MNEAIHEGYSRSGVHIVFHIRNVNSFIETIDNYLKTAGRKVQDLLLEIGEDSLENANDFEDQHQEFVHFKAFAEEAIDWAKKQKISLIVSSVPIKTNYEADKITAAGSTNDARTKLKRRLQELGWEAQYILQLFSEVG